MSEVVIAARAILAVEREAAKARELAGTLCEFHTGLPSTEATAKRWGKARNWLEWLLKASDAAAADPRRLEGITAWLDRGGAPNVAWAWIQASRASQGETPPLPPEGRCAPILTPRWRLSDVDIAARALLAAARPPAASAYGIVVPIDHLNLPRKALAHVAALWGETADWLEKILDVCAAARAEPDVFGHLVAVMDKAGRPAAARGSVKNLHDERRVLSLRPTLARFTTLVVDPPWNEDNLSESAGHDYAQMSLDEIRALPVATWAEDDAHLYLWYTNNTMPLACELVRLWGFEYKSNHTWIKETDDARPKIGLGREFRNSSEGFIFARRGSREALPRRKATLAIPTHHRWPVGANSEKPEAFYDLVRTSSYPRFGEAFQRLARPDFANLYVPVEAPIAVAAE